ncbi:hypothetical protein JCM1841_002016 [Sporobolomyces salmonicolor]
MTEHLLNLVAPARGGFVLSTEQTIGLVAAMGLIYLLVEYRDHAIFTKRRPDLFTPPGQQIPLLGDVIGMIKNQDRAMERFAELKDHHRNALAKGGPSYALSMTLPDGRRMIEVSKPHMLEYIQRTNFQNYVKGHQFFRNLSPLLGHGIFVVDGPAWKTQRQATARIFTGSNFRGVVSTAIQTNLDRLTTIIGRHADRGETFDLADLFFRFTLSSFSEMAFGTDIGALSTESDAPVPFAKAFDYGQMVMNRRFTNPFWPVTERIDGTHARFLAAKKTIDEFSYGIIEEREQAGRGNFTGSQKQEASRLDLLSLYMALRDENGAPLTRSALRDACLNLIICRDTTAQGLSWTFFHLMRHPKLVEPMRKECDETDKVDYDSFKNMTQTNAVFQEGLRLHPSVPKNAWEALNDDQIPNGPRIEKGDLVFWSDWVMGRDTDVWGPDAGEFKPSRWIEEGQLKKESQWKAHFFNGGYRLCLGQNLALYEGAAVLAAIVRDFDLSFAPGYLETTRMTDIDSTPCSVGALTLTMAEPLLVRAARRKRQ